MYGLTTFLSGLRSAASWSKAARSEVLSSTYATGAVGTLAAPSPCLLIAAADDVALLAIGLTCLPLEEGFSVREADGGNSSDASSAVFSLYGGPAQLRDWPAFCAGVSLKLGVPTSSQCLPGSALLGDRECKILETVGISSRAVGV
jgi:hypothetical protein